MAVLATTACWALLTGTRLLSPVEGSVGYDLSLGKRRPGEEAAERSGGRIFSTAFLQVYRRFAHESASVSAIARWPKSVLGNYSPL